ncbi:MAG: glycosyltransferase family 4 protein [Bacteroidales bacterium]
MSNKRKLCLVIPSLSAGGMERVMSELAHYFCKKEDLEVHLVLYGLNREIFYPVPHGLKIHKPAFVFDNRKRFWYTLKTLGFLRREIQKIHPDVILSFGELWNSFVLLALLGLKYRIYVSDRCQPDKKLSGVHDTLRKYLYRLATGVIVQTALAKNIYSGFLPKNKLYVIGNPIRNILKTEQKEREKIVLSVGRLIATKHHDLLIKIFHQIRRPSWQLWIVGNDALKQKNSEKLQMLIKELNAEEYIKLLGTRNDVDELYRRSSIFAFTSSSEGFPNVIGEAMSAGLPVVAFDCVAGPSDLVIDNVTGFLIPLFDAEAFAQKLALLMDDEGLRKKMGNAALKAINTFSIDTIGESFYNLLLNNKKHAGTSN